MRYKTENEIFFLLIDNLDRKITLEEQTKITIAIMNKGEEITQKAIQKMKQIEKDKNMTIEKILKMIETL